MLQTLVLVVLACLTKGTLGEGYYSIVGSTSIKENSDYTVSVTLHDSSDPCDVLITIKNDKTFELSNQVTVEEHSTKIVTFSIGAMEQGEYTLTAEGSEGCECNNSTSIILDPKYESVFIQTDKGMYKPGDKVRFRAVILDSDLKPKPIKELDIYITDAGQNRIKQWLKEDTTMGVYVNELQLSSIPVLGTWTIVVNVNGETIKKTFEVAEYVLPTYEVTVSTPDNLAYSDGVVSVTVTAKYTFGKNVKGTVKVSVSPPDYGWQVPPPGPIKTKDADIDGTVVVEFQIQSDLNVGPDNYQSEFDIKASVTESLTGKLLEGTERIIIYRNKFVISTVGNVSPYKPGVPFTLKLKVATNEGAPYINTVNPLKLSYSSNYDKNNKEGVVFLTSVYLDSNGIATAEITLPESQYGLYIFVEFLDFYDNVVYISKDSGTTTPDDTGNTISATLLTENPKIGDQISVEIRSSSAMDQFTYQLSARGNLVLSETVIVAHQTTYVLQLEATFAMVPNAKLVVYNIDENGDVISASCEIVIKQLNNFVTISTSADKKQPGETIGLTISSKPNSYVCLLGVDKSVKLLKSGNDIVLPDVFDDLSKYAPYHNGYTYPIEPMPMPGPIMDDVAVDFAPARKKRLAIMPPWFPGGGGGWADFNNANLYLLTNANEPQRFYYPWFDGGIALAAAAGGGPIMAPAPEPQGQASTPVIRQYFPESWIYDCTDAGLTGTISRNEIVPDTITSWELTAFATNNQYGLGVIDGATEFTVFKSFFIALNLPYSVIRGETVVIQVLVYNYFSTSLKAEVTLDNSLKEFEFVDPGKPRGCLPAKIELSRKKTVEIQPNEAVSVSFLITPLITGPMTIKVTATSPRAGDGMEVKLPVVPEGVTQYKNKAKFIDLRKTTSFTTDFTVDVPSNAVKDSTKVSFSLIGDIMGVTLQNIDQLAQMPSGCGEQNMIYLAPDVAILIYLDNSGLLTTALRTKLLDFLEHGYQNELSYKHTDGSFSAFGNSDDSGSTWLTAFVIRIFILASKYMDIDGAVIDVALAWLAGQQIAGGSFKEPGRVIHTDMQGEASKGVALTAYVLIAFATDPARAVTYDSVIHLAMEYVVKALADSTDVYSIALGCYAAYVTNHPSKEDLLEKLDGLAIITGDLKHWEKVPDVSTDSWSRPCSVNIEVTGYALMVYTLAGRVEEGLPIMKWLLSQQSSFGGYSGTQDTVVGIQALASFALLISGGNQMDCTISYEQSKSSLSITKDNALVLQTVELPSTTKTVKLQCTGSGFSLAQLSFQYNLNTAELDPRFNLAVTVDESSTDELLILSICASYIPDADGDTSNMAVLRIKFPTGYGADLPTIKDDLAGIKGIKKVESKNSDTVVDIYFDNVGTTQICVKVTAYQRCKIADPKPVPIQIFDFYNTLRQKTVFYTTSISDLCAIWDNPKDYAVCKKQGSKPLVCPRPNKTKQAISELIEWLKDFLNNYFC